MASAPICASPKSMSTSSAAGACQPTGHAPGHGESRASVNSAHCLYDRGMTVEQFFTHYAALSIGDDDRALAAVYAPSFFVAGPKGSMTFANDAKFIDWLAQV